MSSGLLFGTNSIFAKIDNFTSFGLDRKLDDMLGLTPPEIKGPRLSDLTVQTSTYGAHIPRLYGTVAVMGNVIWLENGKLKETVRKKKSGGKGGGGSSEPTTTYSYSATFHLSLCEGPISGIRRMWCGDKLLYNAGSSDLETIIASNKAAKGWRLYLGTDSQLPDSRYEANVGVGNATANRGMAYIAFYDFQLADYSNALQGAQFKVEVVSGFSSTATNLIDTSLSAPAFGYTLGGVDSSAALNFQVNEDGYIKRKTFRSGVWSTRNILKHSDFDAANPIDAQTVESEAWIIGTGGHSVIGMSGHYYYRPGVGFYQPRLARSGDSLIAAGSDGVYFSSGDTDIIFFSLFGNVGRFYGPVSPPVGGATYAGSFMGSPAVITTSGSLFYLYEVEINGSTAIFNIVGSVAPEFTVIQYGINDDGMWILERTGLNDTRLRVYGDGLQLSAEYIGPTYTDLVDTRAFNNRVLVTANYSDLSIIRAWAFTPTNTPGALGDVVNAECVQSGIIASGDIDAALMTQAVRGYRITGGSIRASLEPLQAAFPFDVRPRGYQLQFLPRGQGSVVTIPWEELGATDGDTPKDIFQQSREMDPQLPARTTIKYLDAAREYAIGEQSSERLNTEAINKVDRELALVLTADEAAGVAEVLNFLPWLERTDGAFTLPPIYRYLEPGDVVTVTAPTAAYELRLTEISETQDGRLECKALPSRAALYTPAATGAEGVLAIGTIGLTGESLFVPLDIPVIDETLQDAPGFVGVMTGYSDGWPGGIVVRSSDEGQTWVDLQAYTGKATIGIARGTLPASDCTLIDQRTLVIDLISGELDSVTRDQMLAGVNYAAYGLDGRWEIVRFQNATLQVDGSYLLSGFVRGEKGTEWATGLHVADDYFVILDDPDNAFIGSSVESILAPRIYRGITSGGSLDEAVDVSFTYRGVNIECLSPVYAKGARDGSSNFTGTFTRRSRLSSSWWATGVVAPVGEASESYEVDVMNGAAVVRTIAVTSPSFAYSAANQATDFGSAQASITFRIYQLSATVGRGYPLEVTL